MTEEENEITMPEITEEQIEDYPEEIPQTADPGNFFDKIQKQNTAYQEENQPENQMLGKSSNRKLSEKWSIKIQIDADLFDEVFKFLKELSYSTIFRISKEGGVMLYVIDPAQTQISYVIINKTEITEFIVNDNVPNPNQEQIIYVDMDIVEDISLNNKYPVDIYFDSNRIYLVNAKKVATRKLKDTKNNDNAVATYESYFEKITKWVQNEETKIILAATAFKTSLLSLEKKKSKKEKKATPIEIKFGKTELDFTVSDEVRSLSVQMYGDDIVSSPKVEFSSMYTLENIVKFAKLKLSNPGSEVILHASENKPIIMETRTGAGKVIVYFVIAPRLDNQQQ